MQLSHHLFIYCSPPPDHLTPSCQCLCGEPEAARCTPATLSQGQERGGDPIPQPAGSTCSYSPRCSWPPLWQGLAAGSRSSSLYTEPLCYFLQGWRISLAGHPLASTGVWGCSPECRNLRWSMLNFMRFLPAWLGSSE